MKVPNPHYLGYNIGALGCTVTCSGIRNPEKSITLIYWLLPSSRAVRADSCSSYARPSISIPVDNVDGGARLQRPTTYKPNSSLDRQRAEDRGDSVPFSSPTTIFLFFS